MRDHGRAALLRHNHPVDFDADCELAAVRATALTCPAAWKGPDFHSVDAADTRDFDDATGFELHDGRLRVHVAISHPPAFFERSSVLYDAAIGRGGSVYLPDLVVPMLPAAFSERVAPLSADHDRPALVVSFDALDDGEIDNIDVRVATVRVSENRSYQYADRLLDELDELETACVRWATASRALRQSRGAIHIEIPRVRIATALETPLRLAVEERASPARRLLAECMVRCNEAVGRFCAAHDLAVPYKVRGAYDGPLPAAARAPIDVLGPSDETGRHVAAATRVLRNFPPTTTSLEPAPHAGIGVTSYVQCTSPLRRACDLLTHFQLADFLSGTTPATAAELAGPVMAADLAFRRSERIMREAHRAWLLEWHAQMCGASFRAWPTESIGADRHGEVVLEPTWLVGALRLKNGATPGVPVSVVVRGVDVDRQRLSLSEP